MLWNTCTNTHHWILWLYKAITPLQLTYRSKWLEIDFHLWMTFEWSDPGNQGEEDLGAPGSQLLKCSNLQLPWLTSRWGVSKAWDFWRFNVEVPRLRTNSRIQGGQGFTCVTSFRCHVFRPVGGIGLGLFGMICSMLFPSWQIRFSSSSPSTGSSWIKQGKIKQSFNNERS